MIGPSAYWMKKSERHPDSGLQMNSLVAFRVSLLRQSTSLFNRASSTAFGKQIPTTPTGHRFKVHKTMSGTTIPSVPLSDGKVDMPVLGLGTWKAETGVVANVVNEAIKVGYRAIDCACDYGNETEVGEGIANGIKATGIKREELFVTSKLWNTYHRKEHVRPASMKTLNDLKLDYLDLYLIHFPISLKYVPIEKRYPPEWIHDPTDEKQATLIPEYVSVHETWAALEELVDEGLIRYIGISNFPAMLIMELLSKARIKPRVLQVELHPYLQQERLLEFCKRENIIVTAFSPFGALSYRPLGMDKGDDLLGEDVIQVLANRYDKSPAQITLKWAVQRGTTVIPKTSRVERLVENMSLFDDNWQLSDEDMKQIGTLDCGTRYNNPGEFCVGMGMSIPIYD